MKSGSFHDRNSALPLVPSRTNGENSVSDYTVSVFIWSGDCTLEHIKTRYDLFTCKKLCREV